MKPSIVALAVLSAVMSLFLLLPGAVEVQYAPAKPAEQGSTASEVQSRQSDATNGSKPAPPLLIHWKIDLPAVLLALLPSVPWIVWFLWLRGGSFKLGGLEATLIGQSVASLFEIPDSIKVFGGLEAKAGRPIEPEHEIRIRQVETHLWLFEAQLKKGAPTREKREEFGARLEDLGDFYLFRSKSAGAELFGGARAMVGRAEYYYSEAVSYQSVRTAAVNHVVALFQTGELAADNTEKREWYDKAYKRLKVS